MVEALHPAGGWGPDGNSAALSITFDNLGEAAELELGMWGDLPVGRHHTADFMPKLIDILGPVKATYFMEGSNVALYPQAIKAWHAAGHEVGMHAWRHEIWGRTEPARRRALLARSLEAFRTLGIDPVGFRPPGGPVPAPGWQEFEDAGLLYCSEPGAPGVGRVGGVIAVPFAWRAVDVYMIEEELGFMRAAAGDPEAPFSIDVWREELHRLLAAAQADGGHRTVVFHPNFLGTSREKLDVLREFITIAQNQDIWIAPVRDVAGFAAAGLGAIAEQVA